MDPAASVNALFPVIYGALLLGQPSEDFGIVCGLGLAARPLLTGRSPSALRPDALNLCLWCRNINLPSIRYAFRPRVRVRLTLGGFTFPRKP